MVLWLRSMWSPPPDARSLQQRHNPVSVDIQPTSHSRALRGSGIFSTPKVLVASVPTTFDHRCRRSWPNPQHEAPSRPRGTSPSGDSEERRARDAPQNWMATGVGTKWRRTRVSMLVALLGLCVSSVCKGHAHLLCSIPILTDGLRRKSGHVCRCFLFRGLGRQHLIFC